MKTSVVISFPSLGMKHTISAWVLELLCGRHNSRTVRLHCGAVRANAYVLASKQASVSHKGHCNQTAPGGGGALLAIRWKFLEEYHQG